jgi:hypothetical protein
VSISIPLEKVADNLPDLLAQLPLGETVTLLDTEGQPLALLVSLKRESPTPARSTENWRDEWEELAKKVSAAWKGDKSAVETLIEMRR